MKFQCANVNLAAAQTGVNASGLESSAQPKCHGGNKYTNQGNILAIVY